MAPTVAYLVNQYPKVSHSFIRREILGVEACGIPVLRYSIRACDSELVDAGDKAELTKTRVILQGGLRGAGISLLAGLLRTLATRPLPLLRTVGAAIRLGLRSDRGLVLHAAYLAEACLLYHWFRNAQVQHVHVHFGTNSTTVALLCRLLGGPPYSFTVHGPEEFDKPGAISLEEKINHAAFVVAVSSFGRSQLYRWCHYRHWQKVQIVHCGVDAEFLQQPYTPVPEVPHLVCVGRLSEQKGHLLLLEAATQLALEGVQFKLIFVGDGPLRRNIEATIAQYNLHNHIVITGWASSTEVRQHLVNSRALVLPSFAEGLPVVIMEALALARPVISTYVAGIPELVEPGVCGWLVPAGSVSHLAGAMRAVLQASTEELSHMGKAGVERVIQHHNALTEASKLAELFQSKN
jgi:glycosyltransferase involved in cell wall biosynthesis